MAKIESEFHTPVGPWVASPTLAGLDEKILSLDEETGDHTRLMRFNAGADTTECGVMVHDFWEEIYIIDGEITDRSLGQTFVTGMYACRPPGMRHGPFASASGATVIEFRYGMANSPERGEARRTSGDTPPLANA